jgi:hypothetical protein
MHSDYDLKQEQLNKSSLLSSKKFLEGLMEIFKSHVVRIKAFVFFLNKFYLNLNYLNIKLNKI